MAKLTNAADLFREVLGQTRPKAPAVLKTLTDAAITYSEYPGRDKAGHPQSQYLLDEPAVERLRAVLEARKAPPPSRVPKAQAAVGGPFVDLGDFVTWRDATDALILEQEGKLDQLHKAIEAIAEQYAQLLKGMDPSDRAKMPPSVVTLPTRYKWKVTIAGGTHRMVQSLEERFPMLRFSHIATEGGRPEMRQRQSMPAADVCLVMCSAISHENHMKAKRFYGDKINAVNGSLSSAEAALTVWLHEREARSA